jgi:hypothetical protein
MMAITHNLEILSDKQKSDLQLAQILADNIDSLRPSHVDKIKLTFDGQKFYPVKGFLNKFLIEDIYFAIEGDIEKHKDFILKNIHKEFKDYSLSTKSDSSFENLKINVNAILKYYGYNTSLTYPMYSDNPEFKTFLKRLNESVQKELGS